MANRAEQFVESFSGAVKLMMDRAPKDLSICFSVYARDSSDRTEEEPDGKMLMTSAKRCGNFDDVTFREYVRKFYS